jgi:multidrug efflux pump subunit AcrB
MANFFIDRPIFAWVLAILLCLTGVLAITSLPVEQYPDLAPPNVRITANYPGCFGADAGKYRDAGYRAEHDRSG